MVRMEGRQHGCAANRWEAEHQEICSERRQSPASPRMARRHTRPDDAKRRAALLRCHVHAVRWHPQRRRHRRRRVGRGRAGLCRCGRRLHHGGGHIGAAVLKVTLRSHRRVARSTSARSPDAARSGGSALVKTVRPVPLDPLGRKAIQRPSLRLALCSPCALQGIFRRADYPLSV